MVKRLKPRNVNIFFLYFKSALDYFHLHNLEHIYKRYTVKNFKLFVALSADCRVKQATGFAFKRSSAVDVEPKNTLYNLKIQYFIILQSKLKENILGRCMPTAATKFFKMVLADKKTKTAT